MSASPGPKEVCTISFAANRRVYGQWQSQMPSRFIDELPEEHVEVLTPPGLYGGGRSGLPGLPPGGCRAGARRRPLGGAAPGTGPAHPPASAGRGIPRCGRGKHDLCMPTTRYSDAGAQRV
jgi:DNA helicase-2/ATP-dependent DNA helicase PcrA